MGSFFQEAMNDSSHHAAAGWRYGLVFKNDKFYSFDPRSLVVMRMWPEMRAWRRSPHGSWTHTRRWADDVLSGLVLAPGRAEAIRSMHEQFVGPLSKSQYCDLQVRDSAAVLSAVSSIPSAERSIAAQFKQRRWHLLAMMARCPGATELLDANPALGFALANHWTLHKPAVQQPMRSIRALLPKKQVEIQAWLGFPPTERVRRILKRIQPAAMSGRLLPQLQRALLDERVQQLLAHLPVISEDVLRFVLRRDTLEVVTSPFLHELAAHPPRGAPYDSEANLRVCDWAGNDSDMPIYLASSNQPNPPYLALWLEARLRAGMCGQSFAAPIRSITQLRQWHHSMTVCWELSLDRGRRLEEEAIFSLPAKFGEPPWPGTQTIEPITTLFELQAEGDHLEHCIATYARSIATGRYYAYRMLSPIRATLGFQRTGTAWRFDHIQGMKDVRLTEEMRAVICRQMMELQGNSNDPTT